MSELRVEGPSSPLCGIEQVPGDKSISHRSLMFGAFSSIPVAVRGLSSGEDNRRTRAVLEALGVRIADEGLGAVKIVGSGLGGLRPAGAPLDCGNSGTSIRLFSGLLAGMNFQSVLTGDEYLQRRPMRRVADPLLAMGAKIVGSEGNKAGEIYPPLVLGPLPSRLTGVDWRSKIASAQVKSAVLLAALSADGPTHFTEPSLSRDHTERMLRAMGAPITSDESSGSHRVTLDPSGWSRRLEIDRFDVPGDLSSAAFLWAAAAIRPGSAVSVDRVGLNPTRTGFLDALRAMGGNLTVDEVSDIGGEPVGRVTVRAGALRGTQISGELTVRAIDELPILAVLAAHASGTTLIADAAELRVKESDRIRATALMLSAFGVEVSEQGDGLTIEGRGGPIDRAGVVDSHGDHRIAMAGAILALSAPGVSLIRDTDNIATSFPSFVESMARIGARLESR